MSSLAVAHAQDTHHHSTEKPLIQCHKCGETCKGEVLRVQNKHFHLKCFTCKGTISYNCEMQPNFQNQKRWILKILPIGHFIKFYKRFSLVFFKKIFCKRSLFICFFCFIFWNKNLFIHSYSSCMLSCPLWDLPQIISIFLIWCKIWTQEWKIFSVHPSSIIQ